MVSHANIVLNGHENQKDVVWFSKWYQALRLISVT